MYLKADNAGTSGSGLLREACGSQPLLCPAVRLPGPGEGVCGALVVISMGSIVLAARAPLGSASRGRGEPVGAPWAVLLVGQAAP